MSKNNEIKFVGQPVLKQMLNLINVVNIGFLVLLRINALISNLNNAMAERLNRKIQEVKLVARGYRTFNNFRSAILFFHGGLDLYPLKW